MSPNISTNSHNFDVFNIFYKFHNGQKYVIFYRRRINVSGVDSASTPRHVEWKCSKSVRLKSSPGLKFELMVLTTAPAAMDPRMTKRSSGELGLNTLIMSPGCTPSRLSPVHTRRH